MSYINDISVFQCTSGERQPSLMYDIPRRLTIFVLVLLYRLAPKTWVQPLEFGCNRVCELRYTCFPMCCDCVVIGYVN